MTILVHYKDWIVTPSLEWSDYGQEKSKILEIDKLTDLNSMFDKITNINIIKD